VLDRDVENQAFWFKANEGKTYRGICIGIRGQAYVFGASLRGYFWRLRAPICSPKPGYSESIFALRTKLLIKAAMNDELVAVNVYPLFVVGNRNIRIRGIVHTSKHGLLTMSFRQMDSSCFPAMDSKSLEGFTGIEAENLDEYYDNYEE
jgi:hypothetical protein